MKSRIFILFTLTVFSFGSPAVYGQTPDQLISEKWETGIVEMRDGQQLRGKLFFNFITEILQWEDGVRRQGYTANQVAHFVLINDSSAQSTHYYSFPFDGRGSKLKAFSFYELVHQNGVVAIMSRHEYIYKEKNIAVNDPMNMGFPSDQVATEKVKEIIYLTSAQAGIQPYGTVIKDKNSFIKPGYNSPTVYRDPRGPSLDGITDRLPDQKYNISKKVLEAVFGDQYEKVMAYADEKEIKPNTIEEMKIILDYYADLIKQK